MNDDVEYAVNQPQDPTLNDLFDLLKRGLWVALLVGAALAAGAYFASLGLPAVYETQTTILANEKEQSVPGLTSAPVTAPLLDAEAYKAAVSSGSVQREAAAFFGDKTALDQTTVSLEGELTQFSSLLYVTARGSDPEQAAQAANATAQALVQWDERRAERIIDQTGTRLEAQIKSVRERITALALTDDASSQAQRSELVTTHTQLVADLNLARTLRGSGTSLLEVLEPAPVPIAPVAPSPVRNAVVAFVLGLFLSYGLLLVRNALDTRVRSSADLERLTGLPVLAALPAPSRRSAKASQEAISYLHTNLEFALSRHYPATVVVTSATKIHTHGGVAKQLAASFARANKHVLLVDADPSRAALSRELNPDALRLPSLQHYLQNMEALLEPLQIRAGDRYSFDFVPTLSAPAYRDDLLRQGLRDCVARWRTTYDLILFDGPPVLELADSLMLASSCDLALLCTDIRRESSQQLLSAVSLLKRSNVPTALAAFNLQMSGLTHLLPLANRSGEGGNQNQDDEESRLVCKVI